MSCIQNVDNAHTPKDVVSARKHITRRFYTQALTMRVSALCMQQNYVQIFPATILHETPIYRLLKYQL